MIRVVAEPKFNKKPDLTFIELAFMEEANKVDMNKYRLLEGLSAKKGLYCFIRRSTDRKKIIDLRASNEV